MNGLFFPNYEDRGVMPQFHISEWWELLTEAQKVFWGISIVFSILFLIQFVISLIGVDMDAEADLNTAADLPSSSDGDFAVFSVRSVIAFFTFFGWTGVLMLNGGASVLMVVLFSSLSGMAAMALVAAMMYWFSRLTEVGNLRLRDAINHTAEVYLPIPAHKLGIGKVHVHLKGSMREIDAVTDGDALSTGTKVRIVEVIDDEILLVEKAETLLDQ